MAVRSHPPLAPGEWYETRRFDGAITRILETYVDPSARCNIWHVEGRDRDLLVDSGMGAAPLRSAFDALASREILAVASHCHFDHVGALHEFEHRLAHPAEAAILASPDADNTVWASYRESALLRALPEPGYDLASYAVEPAPPTRLIDEGDTVDLGDRVFSVFHMPGHSPGSICLYERESATLFTGDVLYDGRLLDALYHSDVEQYLETMARLRELPAAVVHCGHYASFGRARMLELIDAYEHSRPV